MRMKKVIAAAVLLLSVSACSKQEEKTPEQGCETNDGCAVDIITEELPVKEAYEALNGAETASGKIYRDVTIPEDHPFEETDLDTVRAMADAGDTFYVYIGDEMCPWCRSVIETAVETAAEAGVEKIWYVQIWDGEHNEVFRDVMSVSDGKLRTEREGSEAYYDLLDRWGEYLGDYTVRQDDKVYETGEKRIFAPSFVYVENGEIRRYTTGTSALQDDAYMELSGEMLAEERELFEEFFAR